MRGLGVNDKTVDLDPATNPDFLLDVRQGLPCRHGTPGPQCFEANWPGGCAWDAVLIDRPYTEEDAAKYVPGTAALPPLNALLKAALERVEVGSCVGVLDYLWPHPGTDTGRIQGKEVAVVAVGTGRNARARWFTVFERVK